MDLADRLLTAGQVETCPICRGPMGAAIACYSPIETAHALVPHRLDLPRKEALRRKLAAMWGDAPCTLHHCESCDFIRANPFVAGDAEFYQLGFPQSNYPARKWEFDRTRQALSALGLSAPRLLEIGAGDGAFLKLVLEDGFAPARLLAFEYSRFGRAAIERLGVACMAADIRTVALAQTFDVVCMFQVLEHLDDYDGVFAALERVVRPGGHLFVSTPNAAWIASNERRRLLQDMPPNHLSRWTETSFSALARRFQWELQACELEPGSRFWTISRALSDRYIRQVIDGARWETWTAEAAARMGNSRVARLFKLGAALTSPACLAAAFRAGIEGTPAPAIWAHFRRPSAA